MVFIFYHYFLFIGQKYLLWLFVQIHICTVSPTNGDYEYSLFIFFIFIFLNGTTSLDHQTYLQCEN